MRKHSSELNLTLEEISTISNQRNSYQKTNPTLAIIKQNCTQVIKKRLRDRTFEPATHVRSVDPVLVFAYLKGVYTSFSHELDVLGLTLRFYIRDHLVQHPSITRYDHNLQTAMVSQMRV